MGKIWNRFKKHWKYITTIWGVWALFILLIVFTIWLGIELGWMK